jgi:hypothetical protein
MVFLIPTSFIQPHHIYGNFSFVAKPALETLGCMEVGSIANILEVRGASFSGFKSIQ